MYFNFFFSWRASSFKTTGKVHVFTIGYFLLRFIFFVRLKNWYWTICWISDIFLLVLQRVRKNFILDQTEIQTADSWGINPSPRGLNLPWTKKKHAIFILGDMKLLLRRKWQAKAMLCNVSNSIQWQAQSFTLSTTTL